MEGLRISLRSIQAPHRNPKGFGSVSKRLARDFFDFGALARASIHFVLCEERIGWLGLELW